MAVAVEIQDWFLEFTHEFGEILEKGVVLSGGLGVAEDDCCADGAFMFCEMLFNPRGVVFESLIPFVLIVYAPSYEVDSDEQDALGLE